MRLLDFMFDRTMHGLNKAMDLSWRRNQVVASNIANAETPKFRASDLEFGKELEQAFGSRRDDVLMRTNSKHLELSNESAAKVTIDYSGVTKADGNNVDLDQQMARLADNSGAYAMDAQLVRHKISLLKSGIRESR